MQVVEGGVEEQTRQALNNLKAVVEASGSQLGKVVKTTVSLFFFFDLAFFLFLFVLSPFRASLYGSDLDKPPLIRAKIEKRPFILVWTDAIVVIGLLEEYE